MIKRDLGYQTAFGKNLRRLREARNWTQIDLAAVSRVNETQISKIEKGEYGPNLQTIRALALALGKYPGELFDFEFELILNGDFSSKRKRGESKGTTSLVNQLLGDGFFATARSVSDVIEKCQNKYNVQLLSSDVSGVLLKLVKSKSLKKQTLSVKGKNAYKSR